MVTIKSFDAAETICRENFELVKSSSVHYHIIEMSPG